MCHLQSLGRSSLTGSFEPKSGQSSRSLINDSKTKAMSIFNVTKKVDLLKLDTNWYTLTNSGTLFFSLLHYSLHINLFINANFMKTLIRQTLIGICFGITLVSLSASANDFEVEQTLEESAESEDNNNGGFLKLGVGRRYSTAPDRFDVNQWDIFISGRYQWHGFFLEVTNNKQTGNNGASTGYNFYNTEQWSFDVNIQGVYGSQEGVLFFYQNDQVVVPKRYSTTMVGLRATGRFEQTSVQFSVSPYSLNQEYDDGVHASVWVDRFWQIKNWQFNAALGVTYHSAEILNYYYGTPFDQFDGPIEGPTIEGFDYQASSGIDVTAQIGVSYPISQDWIFESYARYTDVADSITDSPYIQRFSTPESGKEFGLLVSYVF
jgi:outer membrane protein